MRTQAEAGGHSAKNGRAATLAVRSDADEMTLSAHDAKSLLI